MVKNIVSKVMWVGRATVFLVGLTVIFAVVLGVATTAAAHSRFPGVFHLGHDNPVTALSKMTGSVANGVLQVTNQSTNNTTQDATAITATNNSAGSPTIRASNNKGSPAMELNVACPSLLQCNRGAPMTVNSSARVDGLNADLLDGMDSAGIISSPHEVLGSPTPFNSQDLKEAEVECPPGEKVLGGGYSTWAPGKIVVTDSVAGYSASGPAANAWKVQASEIAPGTTDNWFLAARAICADVQ